MAERRVSITEAKRDLSELVNRVAEGAECFVLTSRGEPKAALVSIEDCERLKASQADEQMAGLQAWLERREKLALKIREERGGRPLDFDAIWEAVKADREARDDEILRSILE